jgi:O-antigen ligase
MSNSGNYKEMPSARLTESVIWPYFACVLIAIAAGFLLDRFGYKAALGFVVSILFISFGVKDFKFICTSILIVLPFVPTVILSKNGSGLSGIRLMAALLSFLAISVFFSVALRPRQFVFPRVPGILQIYLAAVVFGALNGARFFTETPEYLKVLGLIQVGGTADFIYECLFVPVLIVGSSLAAGVLAANMRNAKMIIVPIIGSSVLLALFVDYFALKSGVSIAEMAGQDSRRYLSGTGMHANEIGLTMNMAFAMTVSVFLAVSHKKSKISLGICTAVILSAVFFTFSRGAYLGTMVIVLYFLVTHRSLRKFAAILIMLGVCAALVVPKSVIEKAFLRTSDHNVDSVSSGRVDEIWRPLIPTVLQNPLVGRGHGSILWSDAAKARTILPVGHPHSAYLASLLDLGIVGGVIILVFLAHAWHVLWRLQFLSRPRLLSSFFYGASACIPVLLVQGLTDDSFVPRYTHTFLWLAYGVALGVIARRETKGVRTFSGTKSMVVTDARSK